MPTKLVKMIECIIQKWNLVLLIPVKDGNVETDTILLTNGILQGDSLCPGLYTLSKNVISWLIRSLEGYKLPVPISEKITHSLFIDDLKGYMMSRMKLRFALKLIWEAMRDAGLLWNLKKCKYLEIHRGKPVEGETINVNEETEMKSLKEGEVYEFMGIPQYNKNDTASLQDDLLKMTKQRAYIVWSSNLFDLNKVIATNRFINSVGEYYFWSLKFNIDTLRQFDTTIRKIMNKCGAKHTNQMNALLYLPRSKGGHGLRSLEYTYKEIKIKAAAKLMNDVDKRMRVVAQFHQQRATTTSYSILKDALKYAAEYNLNLDFSTRKCILRYTDIDGELKETDNVSKLSTEIVKKRNHTLLTEVLNAPWQGVNYVNRVNDTTPWSTIILRG